MEEVPHWKQAELEAKRKKELQAKYPNIGKIVKYEGEYGVIIFGDFGNGKEEEIVRWDSKDEADTEQFGFFDYEYIDNHEFEHINPDGTLKQD